VSDEALPSSEDETGQLVDGSQPRTPDDLFGRLDALGATHATHRHARVYTVEEARVLRGDLPGCHTKNLFLRNKKARMWLFVCEQDRVVDLMQLATAIGEKRLSFGSPRRLMEYLGVVPGAVSPFAVINDTQRAVQLVLDESILEMELLNFHPLDNSMTTSIGRDDFLAFVRSEGHEPLMVDLH
jgi:Ala-tRNA(Pro) deacylase